METSRPRREKHSMCICFRHCIKTWFITSAAYISTLLNWKHPDISKTVPRPGHLFMLLPSESSFKLPPPDPTVLSQVSLEISTQLTDRIMFKMLSLVCNNVWGAVFMEWAQFVLYQHFSLVLSVGFLQSNCVCIFVISHVCI